ncbi:MAG: YdeI/OmpD-associated family protein [Sphingomonas sp.]|nr:YdeI/OmpD-associated family protein [Sphingomonas sp.]
MAPAGLAEIEAAQADGRWAAAYAPASRAQVPADLQAALDRSPAAAEFFATLTGANRYAILYRIDAAKKSNTRARRIAEFVSMLERGETVHGSKKPT